ncbi:MAG: hypothetical protein U5J99_08500 [Parvularculaceae bacterium]|nr:hypothetical protein [Parvularculaceae bacterium]
MSAGAREITMTIRMLMDIGAREARALARRNIEEIVEFVDIKHTLAGQLEAVLAQGDNPPAEDARRDLVRLRKLLIENEARLAAMRDNIARARVRLEKLVAAERSCGVYGAHAKARFEAKPTAGRNA